MVFFCKSKPKKPFSYYEKTIPAKIFYRKKKPNDGIEAILLLVFLLCSTPAILTLSTPPNPSSGSLIPSKIALFVLGDSTVNCGDNTILYPILPHNLSSSSFCFGSSLRLLPDLIAEKMGIPRPPPFYSGNWSPSALSAGVNFGSMKATILSPSTGTNLSSIGSTVGKFLLQTLSEQVRQVYESLQLISLGAGPCVAGRIASSSLFFLSFGYDDYAGIFTAGVSAAAGQPKYGRHGIARLLVSEMVQAIKDLYKAGVRRIVVAGVGPLGCSPRLRWEVASHAPQAQHCFEEANDVVADYNSRLAYEIREVGSVLSGARIVFCDVYKGTMKIISNHEIYGFSNTGEACCGAGLFGGLIGCWAKSMACNEPSAHIWWDMYRTTEAVSSQRSRPDLHARKPEAARV